MMPVFPFPKVTEILKNAKFIEPNLGDLPGALKGRLGDSNKNLVMTTLNIVSTLASSMGSSCSRHAKILVPGILSTLTDSKVCGRTDTQPSLES